jgi:hypothetical protein
MRIAAFFIPAFNYADRHALSETIPRKQKEPEIAKLSNCQNGNLEILEISPKVPIVPTVPNPQSEDLTETTEKTPTFPEIIYQNLPEFLQRATAKTISAEDKDLLLPGSLVVISPCLPNIYGIYAERKVFPNLFLFITASPLRAKVV